MLVAANEPDVPFDLKHIRVIYYDVQDPFWGSKLIDKLAENILSAIKNQKRRYSRHPASDYRFNGEPNRRSAVALGDATNPEEAIFKEPSEG